MMRRKYMFIIALVAVLGLVVLFPKKDLWVSNTELLKDKMHAELTDGGQVKLSEFTPFEWDEVYSFNPYASKEVIYETIGYKWDRISETVSEGMNQIVFMKGGKLNSGEHEVRYVSEKNHLPIISKEKFEVV